MSEQTNRRLNKKLTSRGDGTKAENLMEAIWSVIEMGLDWALEACSNLQYPIPKSLQFRRIQRWFCNEGVGGVQHHRINCKWNSSDAFEFHQSWKCFTWNILIKFLGSFNQHKALTFCSSRFVLWYQFFVLQIKLVRPVIASILRQ